MSRSLPAIIVITVTALAASSAWATNAVIARLAMPDEPVPEPGAIVASGSPSSEGSPRSSPLSQTPARPRALTVDQYIDGIMKRNLFDVNIIAMWAEKGPTTAVAAGGAVSDLKVKLLGTMVATPAEYSNALIADEDSPDLPSAYSIGDILKDRTVDSIEADRVGLKRADGTIEYLTMGSADLVRATASADPGASEEGGVTQSGENKFIVSRELFDKSIGDLEGISKMGRALLHRGPDGEFDGYRLSAIRRNTIADQLGIKNGDIIHSVNGQPLNSVQAAMNAYGTMQTQSSFCFEISRRGSPTELCYEVR